MENKIKIRHVLRYLVGVCNDLMLSISHDLDLREIKASVSGEYKMLQILAQTGKLNIKINL